MFCFNCGKEIREGARFCIYCGEDLSELLAATHASTREELPVRKETPRRETAPKQEKSPKPKPSRAVKEARPPRIEYKRREQIAPQKTDRADNILYLASMGCAVLAFILSIFEIRNYTRGILPLIAALLLATLAFLSIPYDSIPAVIPLIVLIIGDIRSALYSRRYGVRLSVPYRIRGFFLCTAVIWMILCIFKIIRGKRLKAFGQLGFLIGYLVINFGFFLSYLKYGGFYLRIHLYAIAVAVSYILIISRKERFLLKETFGQLQGKGAGLPNMDLVSERLKEGASYLSRTAQDLSGSGTFTPDEYADGNYKKYPHPYHELGGWLKAIVVLGYIGCALYALSLAITTIGTLQIINQIGGIGLAFRYSRGLMIAFFTAIAFGAVAIWFLFKYFRKIQTKDPSFLRYYHTLSIIGTIAASIYMMVTSGFWMGLFDAALGILSMYAFTSYFCKSVRVRTYMGTDQYLRMSYFTRNVPSPIPADIKPFEEA